MFIKISGKYKKETGWKFYFPPCLLYIGLLLKKMFITTELQYL